MCTNILPHFSEEGRLTFAEKVLPDIETAFDKGLGRRLLEHLLESTTSNEVWLRASVNAVTFYESQGFVATDSEAAMHGIRFVPMVWLRTALG